MALVGLKNLYYAELGSNGTYGTPAKIAEAVSVDINPNVATSELYGDDMSVATDIRVNKVEVTVEATDIPLEIQAVLLGHTIADSIMTANMSDVAPYVGIAFESEKHNGGIRCVKLLKGKFAESQETINTRGENIEYQTPKLKGNFVADASGDWKKVKDFAEGASTAGWYSEF